VDPASQDRERNAQVAEAGAQVEVHTEVAAARATLEAVVAQRFQAVATQQNRHLPELKTD